MCDLLVEAVVGDSPVGVIVVLVGEPAVHLAEHLQIRLSFDEGKAIDGVIDLVEIHPVKGDGVVVVRKILNQSAGRRDNDLVLAVGVDDVEDSVLVVVRLVGIGIALDKAEPVSQ